MEIRSKYQKKTLEEREYLLEESTCPFCGHVFMVDSDYCPTEYSEELDEYQFVITCPYCGKKTRIVI